MKEHHLNSRTWNERIGITNRLSIKHSSILMISVSENFLVESECVFSTEENHRPTVRKCCSVPWLSLRYINCANKCFRNVATNVLKAYIGKLKSNRSSNTICNFYANNICLSESFVVQFRSHFELIFNFKVNVKIWSEFEECVLCHL